MQLRHKVKTKKFLKYIAAGVLTFGLVQVTNVVKAQGPPPPPPPPEQVLKKVGNGLKKINPFKKGRKPARSGAHAGPPAPGTPPPPPPNPLKVLKKGPGLPPPPPRP